jgi:hypothetical protein
VWQDPQPTPIAKYLLIITPSMSNGEPQQPLKENRGKNNTAWKKPLIVVLAKT